MFSVDSVWHKVLMHPCGSGVLVFHVPSADTHLLSPPTADLLRYIHSGDRSYAELETYFSAGNAGEMGAAEAGEYLDSALAELVALDLVQEAEAVSR